MHLLLKNQIMTLLNIAYTPKCDPNFILLGHLCKSEISYNNYPGSIIHKQRESRIGVAKRYKNFFILETGLKGKAMLVQERG